MALGNIYRMSRFSLHSKNAFSGKVIFFRLASF
jgi:hypothetical protein